MAEKKSTMQEFFDLRKAAQEVGDLAKAARDSVTGLGDRDQGPLVQGRIFGQGHATAMVWLGLKELRNAVSPSRDSAADTEIGLYGTLTQGEIAQARKGPGAGPEQEAKFSLDDLRAFANERAKEAEQRMDRGNEKGLEM
jgi:hypothetical protein